MRAILGQQITLKAARTLARRFVQQFGTTIETPFDGVDRLFPAAEAVAQYSPADIGALGIVSQRARAIVALARAVVDDALLLTPGTDVERALDTLRALPGAGGWTAQYIAMRALHGLDAFPISDVAISRQCANQSLLRRPRVQKRGGLGARTQSSISGNHWRKPNDSSIDTFNHRLHPHAESRR